MNRATKVVASTFAGMFSIASVMHGCFEILQGNSVPGGLIIDAIGPGQRIWPYAALHAFTVMPNFIVAGVLAIIFGILATVWAVAFIDRKSGARVMFLLSMILFLVGGGIGPLFNGTFASLIATQINRPLTWWRTHLSARARNFLAQLWPGIIFFYGLVFLLAVETTIFGWPLNLLFDASTTYAIVLNSGNLMLLVILLSALAAFAYDVAGAETSWAGK